MGKSTSRITSYNGKTYRGLGLNVEKLGIKAISNNFSSQDIARVIGSARTIMQRNDKSSSVYKLAQSQLPKLQAAFKLKGGKDLKPAKPKGLRDGDSNFRKQFGLPL